MLLSRQIVSSVIAFIGRILAPLGRQAITESSVTLIPTHASSLFLNLVAILESLVRHRKDHITHLFPHLVASFSKLFAALRRAGFGSTGLHSTTAVEEGEIGFSVGRRAEREARASFPPWVWAGGPQAIGRAEAKAVGRLLSALATKTPGNVAHKRKSSSTEKKDQAVTSLTAPLSKHAPFVVIPYLRACVDSTSPIPLSLRQEMQGGWYEVFDTMGKWEREALLKGFLGDDEDAERNLLREMWKSWEKERYRGV